MQDDKIDYVTKAGAIGEITCDSCKQKRASSQDSIIVSRRAQKIRKHRSGSDDCKHYEEPASEGPAFLQLTESNPAILSVNEIEEPANNGSIIAEPKPAHRPRLTRLVDHVDAEAGKQIARAPTEARLDHNGLIRPHGSNSSNSARISCLLLEVP